jgi:hypothetical protein
LNYNIKSIFFDTLEQIDYQSELDTMRNHKYLSNCQSNNRPISILLILNPNNLIQTPDTGTDPTKHVYYGNPKFCYKVKLCKPGLAEIFSSTETNRQDVCKALLRGFDQGQSQKGLRCHTDGFVSFCA